jgi:hypothetical protein
MHAYALQPESQVAQQCCSEVCNAGVPFDFAPDISCRRWQSGVIELLQCLQWQERLLFKARCDKMDSNLQGRDALIASMNKLDLWPFWRPATLNLDKYADNPPEDAPKGYTRTGTPLPHEDESYPEDAWDPRAQSIGAGGWEFDVDSWATQPKVQKKTYSAYFAVLVGLDSPESQ